MVIVGLVLVVLGLVRAWRLAADDSIIGTLLLLLVGCLVGGPLMLEGLRALRYLPRMLQRPLDFYDDPSKPLVVTLAAYPQVPAGTRIPVVSLRLAVFALGSSMWLAAAMNLSSLANPTRPIDDPESLYGVTALFIALSGLAVWAGMRTVRSAPNAAVVDGRYAFLVDEGVVRFRTGQRWPLEQTTLVAVDGPKGGRLKITYAHGRKSFTAKKLQLPPSVVVDLVESRRAVL